jgi:hypothetical protein
MKANCLPSSSVFAQKHDELYLKALQKPADHTYPFFHHYEAVPQVNAPPRAVAEVDRQIHQHRKRMENRSDIFHRGQTLVLDHPSKDQESEEDIALPQPYVFEEKPLIQTR